jgi:hypothetical protein
VKILPDWPQWLRNAFRAAWIALAVCLVITRVPHSYHTVHVPVKNAETVYVFFWVEVWNFAFHQGRLEKNVFHYQLTQIYHCGSLVFLFAYFVSFIFAPGLPRTMNVEPGNPT